LLALVEGTVPEKGFDVVPAERLFREESPPFLALKIVPKASYEKVFLIAEF
jgi:hypothetical protein